MGITFKLSRGRMRVLILALAALLHVCACDPWEQWKSDYGVRYRSAEEEQGRKEIFLNNYRNIVKHNAKASAGEVSWTKGLNQWSDKTREEWATEYGLMSARNHGNGSKVVTSASRIEVSGNAPEYWSWKDQGSVSSVKNQGPCGSCAAFAAIATIESQILEQTGEMMDLSEEHIMECGTGSDDACEGWWTGEFIKWIVSQNGGRVEMESCYPYTASDDLHCDADSSCNYWGAHVTENVAIPPETSEEELKEWVWQQPVYVSVYASYLFDYNGGVYDDEECCDFVIDPNCSDHATYNHAVELIGYGVDEGTGVDYWLAKNSWGTGWGEDGFFRIKRGYGHCGFGYQGLQGTATVMAGK